MPNERRFGLIEVGSNNIRYLVADYSDGGQFNAVFSDTAKHDIHPNGPSETAVVEANAAVATFIDDAQNRDCEVVLAYGTAACRTAVEQLPGVLSRSIKVLTPKEEALAGWVAGFACTPMTDGTTCTVIDEGSGSTEIMRATWTGANFDNTCYYSTHIGSVSLLESYKESAKEHIERVRHVIASMIPVFDEVGLTPGSHGKLFMIGGVATSVGWLATKGTAMQNYRPSEINGAILEMSMIDDLQYKLATAFRTDPRTARLAVDARRGSEDHILKVLSSLPFLGILASYLDPQGPYYVSGMGTRHGVGFMLWHGLIEPVTF
jgi:exopolyphosphatase/pppGpp-phosphohydrolase